MDPQDFAPEPAPNVAAAPFEPAAAPVADAVPAYDAQAAFDSADAEFYERAAIQDNIHVIERRSFARDDANQPMPVTRITTGA